MTQIFDEPLRHLRRDRAARRMAKMGLSFLLERCLDDLAERLQDVNRRFDDMLLIGPHDLRNEISARLPEDRRPRDMRWAESLEDAPKADLVVSLLELHSENDFPGHMARMAQSLRPDGLFIAAIFGGDTLTELRQACYKTDDETLGGLTARVYPMVTHSVAAPLLTRAGLNLPVVDMDRFTVRYSSLLRLVGDLRDLGETNMLRERSPRYVGRDYFPRLAANYAEMFGEGGKLPASFEILWLTGWAPHESQQKPLKPGSAKMRLSDALGATEKVLKP